MTRPKAVPKCHPDRPHRARHLCGPCYVVAQREGKLFDHERVTVDAEEIVDLLEIDGPTWEEASRRLGVTRTSVRRALEREKKPELIRQLNIATYGESERSRIMSVVHQRRPEIRRGLRKGVFDGKA